MAQKPNFLKKITVGLAMASTAALIAAASSSAMGANQNINAPVNLDATGIPAIVNGDSLTYVVQAGGPFTATATGAVDSAGNPTLLFGSISMLQAGNFVVNAGVNDITIGSVSAPANTAAAALLSVNVQTGTNLILNGAPPGVAAFAVNTYDRLGPIALSNAVAGIKISLAANGADGTKTLTFSNAATIDGSTVGNGTITVDDGNTAIFNGAIGSTKAIRTLILGVGSNATLNASANFDNTQGDAGIEIDTGTLTVADGINIVGTAPVARNVLNIDSNGNAGTLTFAGDSTVSLDIGAADHLAAVNIGGILTFQGNSAVANTTFAASAINLSADSVIEFMSGNHVVIGAIVVKADQQGVIDASNLTNAQTLTIAGAIGANHISLNQLNAGVAKVILITGAANINELVLGNGSVVTLDQQNYKIAKTTNTAAQGKIVVSQGAGNVTTLVAGTNLGSNDTPLAEINFDTTVGGADVTLTVPSNVNLYANTITTTAKNLGSFAFNDAKGVSIVSGAVGSTADPFNTVTVQGGITARFAGEAIFNGATTIEAGSTFQIGNTYTANSIVSADNTGILQFINQGDIVVNLQNQAAAVNALAAIKVSGGNVTINQTGNAGLFPGLATASIIFADNSAGSALNLPIGTPFDGINILSTVKNPVVQGIYTTPTVIVNDVDSVIAAGQVIGDAKNIVGLVATDNQVEVNPATLYAAIAPLKNNTGTVILNGAANAAVPNKIYGLGIENAFLKEVTVTTNYQNLGDTYVKNLTVNDDLTFTAGGEAGANFNGQISLGVNSIVIFADQTAAANSLVATGTDNNGTVTFLGGAHVGKIGDSDESVTLTEFKGAAGSLAVLQSPIYSQKINFGASDIFVGTSNASLNAKTIAINANIDLNTNSLTFASGVTTLDNGTSFDTQLTNDGVLGNIVIVQGAVVNVANNGNIATKVTIQDSDSLPTDAATSYTFIKGGANFNGGVTATLNLSGNRRFIGYSLLRADNGDYVLTRSNNAEVELTQLFTASKFNNTPGVGDNLKALIASRNSANVKAFLENVSYAKNDADVVKAVGALVTDNTANVTNSNIDVVRNTSSHIDNRVNTVRNFYSRESVLLASPEAGAVGAGDEPKDNVAYGIWAKPFFTDVHQKIKGAVAGYKAKTTGVLIGLDTMANDNLMIGAAIGITKTDIKHQDYSKGNKTEINGFSASLYGAQQLVSEFFAQGNATFSFNQVKNKSQRYVFNNSGAMSNQTAAGSYDNMTFGGNLMVGYDAKIMEGILLTPMAGINYLKTSDENYKETGTTHQNKQVSSKFGDRTDLVVGARGIGNTINLLTDFAICPEAHAFVTHKINGKLSKVQAQLDGQTQPFVGQPNRIAKTSYNLGLSLTARPDDKMEYGVGYDANIASKYIAHQGSLKVRVNF